MFTVSLTRPITAITYYLLTETVITGKSQTKALMCLLQIYSCTLFIFFVVFAHALVAFSHRKRAVEPRKLNLIMPSPNYKKMMPTQQSIRMRVLL